MLSVDKIQRWVDVRELAGTWDDLLDGSAGHLFLARQWVIIWGDFFGRDVAPYFLRVREEERTVAIFPLVLRRTRWRRLPARQLDFCVNSHSPWGGAIVPRNEAAVAQAVWRFLKEQSDWDIFRLDMIPRQGMGDIFQSQAPEQGLYSYSGGTRTFYLPIDGTWESYLKSRTKRFRRKLAVVNKPFGNRGTFEAHVFDTPESVAQAMETFLHIDGRSWKQERGEAITDHRQLMEYYSNAARTFAALGRCFVVVMTLGEEPVSSALFFDDNIRGYGFKTSFVDEPGCDQYSPGFLAIAAGARECWRRGLKELHFLSSSSEWERWTEQSLELRIRLVFHPSIYGKVLLGLERFARAIGGGQDRLTFEEAT